MEALRNMTKESVRFDGSSYFVDSRLVANGFKIKITPGMIRFHISLSTTCL